MYNNNKKINNLNIHFFFKSHDIIIIKSIVQYVYNVKKMKFTRKFIIIKLILRKKQKWKNYIHDDKKRKLNKHIQN